MGGGHPHLSFGRVVLGSVLDIKSALYDLAFLLVFGIVDASFDPHDLDLKHSEDTCFLLL